MQFDKGYISPYFVTDAERQEAVIEDAIHPLEPGQDHLGSGSCSPFLKRSCSPASQLVIIAEDIEGEALATLVVNKIRGTFATRSAVKAPGFGERRKAMLHRHGDSHRW